MSNNTVLRPEAELLLCSARTRIDPDTAVRIQGLVRMTIDWEYLLNAASSHRVLSLLYRSLNQLCSDAVPPATLEVLREYFHWSARRNMFLTCELVKLLKAFEEAGVTAIPFKGPVVATLIYGNVALRHFNDLDIFVHKRDIPRAKDLLISKGFRLGASPNAAAEDSAFLTEHIEPDQIAPLQPNFYYFVRDSGTVKVNVDLQWRIARRLFSFSLESKRLWNHLDSVSLGGTTFTTFSPEALLSVLCAHGCKHSWQRLKWICDIAEQIERIPSNQRKTILERAFRNGNKRMLSLGLLLAHDLLGAALPAVLLQRIRSDSTVESAAVSIRDRLFVEGEQALSGGKRTFFYFKMRSSRERLQYCSEYLAQHLGLIFSPTAIERSLLPLPKGLRFLYYAVRPLRLTAKYALHRSRAAINGKAE